MDGRHDHDRRHRGRSSRQQQASSQARGRWGDVPPVPEPAAPKPADKDFRYMQSSRPTSERYSQHDDRRTSRPPKRARTSDSRPSGYRHDETGRHNNGHNRWDRHEPHAATDRHRPSVASHEHKSEDVNPSLGRVARHARPTERSRNQAAEQQQAKDVRSDPSRGQEKGERLRATFPEAVHPQLGSNAIWQLTPDYTHQREHIRPQGHSDGRTARHPGHEIGARVQPWTQHGRGFQEEQPHDRQIWPPEAQRGWRSEAPWGQTGRARDPFRKASWSHDMFEEINRSPPRVPDPSGPLMTQTALRGASTIDAVVKAPATS
ncbi:hypothetical protein WJX74_006822 [Apatococcus lobatus]|uniref:Uncharacterized protein n=1 Tax=Apatococcus lobatus TaxID=904363 RepID=A0AAW1S9I1_9CHLO